jgi:hypothetical protein
MFRREMRREERRDVVEVAAVGGVVHETRQEHGLRSPRSCARSKSKL